MRTLELNQLIPAPAAVGQLQRFRGELADLAFSLEKRGRIDAADVVNAIAARVADIEAELTAAAQPSGT